MVRLLDVFAESRSALVIVWELVQGPDLLELLNEAGGRLSEPAVAFYVSAEERGGSALRPRGHPGGTGGAGGGAPRPWGHLGAPGGLGAVL